MEAQLELQEKILNSLRQYDYEWTQLDFLEAFPNEKAHDIGEAVGKLWLDQKIRFVKHGWVLNENRGSD